MTEETTPDYREILLSLCGSLSMCDNMSDVCGDVEKALELAGIDLPPDKCSDIEEIGTYLGNKHGVVSLYGTPLGSDDDEEID